MRRLSERVILLVGLVIIMFAGLIRYKGGRP